MDRHIGYIKLHRRILTNDVFINDPTAWHIFEYLMLMCNWQTGKRDIGRFQLARELKIKPATIYAALKRLEKKYKMITQVSNNRFTTISIVNWATYQQADNTTDNIRITSESQQNNTNKEIKKYRNIEKQPVREYSQDEQRLIRYLDRDVPRIKNGEAYWNMLVTKYKADRWAKKLAQVAFADWDNSLLEWNNAEGLSPIKEKTMLSTQG